MSKPNYKKCLLFLVALVCFAGPACAHNVVIELENMSGTDQAALYFKLGYKHILPLGLDHILFVLSLYLLSPKLKTVLMQSLAFTLAHSVTLGLAMYGLIKAPSAIVEPLIALSIAYVALENIFRKELKPSRLLVVFCFGLVHGLGFASALNQMGLPPNAYLSSLVLFNLGVEAGQLTVILTAFFLFGKWYADRSWYRRSIVVPLSLVITAVATFWIFQRV